MNFLLRIDQIHAEIRQNRWHWLFAIFCRFSLALGFIPAGITKIMGERFASGLSVNHPMGQYLEALHGTGYYYTFIGVIQIIAGILLIIPRTVLLGVLLYLPIVLNICILSFAVRFDGSFVLLAWRRHGFGLNVGRQTHLMHEMRHSKKERTFFTG